ncbi:hypothetical protein [Vibrio sp. MA40-2]|uniref:hypothetical protein n=1 Tax=Vibrio sp. MA40-2 TaxID=3391828 RepID=UPI0039A73925
MQTHSTVSVTGRYGVFVVIIKPPSSEGGDRPFGLSPKGNKATSSNYLLMLKGIEPD